MLIQKVCFKKEECSIWCKKYALRRKSAVFYAKSVLQERRMQSLMQKVCCKKEECNILYILYIYIYIRWNSWRGLGRWSHPPASLLPCLLCNVSNIILCILYILYILYIISIYYRYIIYIVYIYYIYIIYYILYIILL